MRQFSLLNYFALAGFLMIFVLIVAAVKATP